MLCPSCGYENPEGARLCRGCGRELLPTDAEGMGIGGIAAFQLGRPAGFWIRLLASFIDSIPLFLVSALLSWLIFGENLFDSISPQFETAEDGTVTSAGGGFTPGQALNLVLNAIYATAFVSLLGGTLGVLLFRMRILRPDGALLGPGRAFARYVVLTACFALFLIPVIVSAFMVAFRGDKRGIHDLICDTVVVIRSVEEPGPSEP